MGERVGLDRLAVMRSDVQVDPDDASLTEKFEDRAVKDHRTAAGDPRLDDQGRFRRPDDLLRGHDVGRYLDDRDTQPRPHVRITQTVRFGEQRSGPGREIRVGADEQRTYPTLGCKRGAV